MPPSGFNNKQSHGIALFLESCVDDLVRENVGMRSPKQAIQRELQHIAKDLGDVRRGVIPTAVLELARSFYETLDNMSARDFDELKRQTVQLLSQIRSDIEAIKVADS